MSPRYLLSRLPFRPLVITPWVSSSSRLSSHVTGWEPKPCLTLDMKVEFERTWKNYVDNFSLTDKENCPNTYILSMFPYPSGNLHMGHVRVYTMSDTLARFYRMLGHNVLHPMGWDAFGLPAENAALDRGEDPATWTDKNINIMRSQLKQLGFSFDWDREFATCHPEYYKWTQFIFLQMFKAGLIYRKASQVNWDPVDKTVLADEQIDEKGNSWRSGAKTEKILLTQWFVKSTKFSSALIKELATFKKDDWADVVNMQKSWIGDVNGVVFDWTIECTTSSLSGVSIPIWTDKPDQVLKVKFVAVTPGSMLDAMQTHKSSKEYQFTTAEGELKSFKAVCLDFMAFNPFTEEKVPVYLVDGLLPFPTQSDSYMGVPLESEIDSIFATLVGLPTTAHQHSSSKWKSSSVQDLCAKAQAMGFGGHPASSNLKDWLISRQRYWGTPIPIIHCSTCGTVPVPEEQLPVQLPHFPSHKKRTDSIASPLAQDEDWVKTTCPQCGASASRETDTMDTFVDSSWYFLRFLDPHNDKLLVNLDQTKKFMPVSIYVGGKEHATLHMYYARIVSHFLHQIGITSCPEPFKRLLVQGMVMGQTFIEKETGRYLKRSDVEFRGKEAFSQTTGKSLEVRWEKMSKSKHNGVDPAEAISLYGVDTTRLLMLADTAAFSQRNWDPEGSRGVFNWQNNLYMLVSCFVSIRKDAMAGKVTSDLSSKQFQEGEEETFKLRNRHLSTITHNYKNTNQFMVAIKSMQTMTKKLRLLPHEVLAFSSQFEEALAMLIITLAPMAPHFASELWQGFVSASGRLGANSTQIQWNKPVLHQNWPEISEEFELHLLIRMNNKDVWTVPMSHGTLKISQEDDLLKLALQQEKIKILINNRPFEVRQIEVKAEKGAIVHLKVPGLQISENDSIPSYSKKGRQETAKQKKKKLTEH